MCECATVSVSVSNIVWTLCERILAVLQRKGLANTREHNWGWPVGLSHMHRMSDILRIMPSGAVYVWTQMSESATLEFTLPAPWCKLCVMSSPLHTLPRRNPSAEYTEHRQCVWTMSDASHLLLCVACVKGQLIYGHDSPEFIQSLCVKVLLMYLA